MHKALALILIALLMLSTSCSTAQSSRRPTSREDTISLLEQKKAILAQCEEYFALKGAGESRDLTDDETQRLNDALEQILAASSHLITETDGQELDRQLYGVKRLTEDIIIELQTQLDEMGVSQDG